MLIFVYGTLKKGYSNNRLLNEAKFMGEGFTREKFCMVNSGFPVILDRGDDRYKVVGEVYDIADRRDILENLDRLESEGWMYDRKSIRVYLTRRKKSFDCQAYVGCEDRWSERDHDNDAYLRNGKLVWSARQNTSGR